MGCCAVPDRTTLDLRLWTRPRACSRGAVAGISRLAWASPFCAVDFPGRPPQPTISQARTEGVSRFRAMHIAQSPFGPSNCPCTESTLCVCRTSTHGSGVWLVACHPGLLVLLDGIGTLP